MGFGVRQAAVAGAFYPDDPEQLKKMIGKFLNDAKETKLPGNLKALVVPHAGYIYSGPVAGYGYKLLSKYKGKIKRIILLGPSHYAGFYGACEAGFDLWQTPLGEVKTLTITKPTVGTYPEAHQPEHCLEVQIPFIQTVLGEVEVWPILCGQIDPVKLAKDIVQEMDEKTIVIASSDLSHYKTYDDAKKTDATANEFVPKLNIEKFQAVGDACGKIPILTLMHIAKEKKWKGKLLDYRNSGDTAGPKSRVVGYGCYAFYERNTR
ncbi:Memo-like protein [Candidatus Bilamarchaeum dharawalense]|uniref:MEMO1 family protein LFW2832_00677 n=1 Tax=Candidatus Bilamarchaeum dharawalense TaxID=2885759 RepID=A0A5E4LSG4_9ARCH|nr:Memo-like protein [Candidatus Bilamarchaeum dharawalense]